MKTIRNLQGFTLIELVLYIGLLCMLIAIMSQLFIATLGVKLESEENSYMQQDSGYILARMAYDIHRASRIIAPALGQTGTSLTLGILEDGVEQSYTYSVSDGVLSLSDGATVEPLHSTSSIITVFTIMHAGNSATVLNAKDTITSTITATSAYVLPSGEKSMTFQTTEGLR